MPPPRYQPIARRNAAGGKYLAIAFAGVALFLILVCVAWGCFVPKWRRKHPQRPSSTRFNCIGCTSDYATAPRAPPRFPSHPALLRGVRMQESHELPRYNPRTETPFPSTLCKDHNFDIHRDGCVKYNQVYSHSQHRKQPCYANDLPRQHEPPITFIPLQTPAAPSIQQSEEHRQCELLGLGQQIPGPRLAVGAHPFTERLGQFPLLASNSTRDYDNFHCPDMTFKKVSRVDLEPLAPEPAVCNLCSVKVETHDDTRTNISSAPRCTTSVTLQADQPDKSVEEVAVLPNDDLGRPRAADTRPTQSEEARDNMDACGRQEMFQKIRLDYQNMKNHENEQHVGLTIDEVWTPVVDVHDRYRRSASRIKFKPHNTSLRRSFTPSTEPLTIAVASDNSDDIAANATPPVSAAPPNNSPALLPTPFRLRRVELHASTMSSSPLEYRSRRRSPQTEAMLATTMQPCPLGLQKILPSKRHARKSTGFYHPNLSLRGSIAKSNAVKFGSTRTGHGSLISPKSRRFSLSSETSSLSVLKAPKAFRSSWRMNSLHSQDTKGTRIIRSPTLAANAASTVVGHVCSREQNPTRPPSGNPVWSRIDNWIIHTADLYPRTWPTLTQTRFLSDIRPQGPGVQSGMGSQARPAPPTTMKNPTNADMTLSIPRICIGRLSDDVFGDEQDCADRGRVQKQVREMEMANSDIDVSRYLGRTAPGGAEWI